MNKIAKRANKLAVLVAATLGLPAVASAAVLNLDVDPATAGVQATNTVAPGSNTTVTLNVVGDGAVTNVSGTFSYNTALFDVSTPDATCTVVDASGIVAFATTSSAASLPSGTLCTFTVTATGASGTSSTFVFDDANTTFAGGTGTTDDATINIQTPVGPTPTAPTIALSPNPASVPAGPAGAGSVAVTIDTPVDATNGGNATVTCAIPAGTAGFTAGAVTGNPFTSGTGSVTVGCTRGATADTQTLTCTATAGGGATGTTTATTAVTCPAETAVSSEFNGALNATLVGPPSGTATGSIAITNSGDGPLTIACGAPSAGFTVVTPPAASTPAGGSTSIGLSCAVPAGGATTGSLVCTTNDPDDGEGTVTFALSCVAQAVAVPTMGGFAKGMLAAMLAAVGLLGFALRRKLV